MFSVAVLIPTYKPGDYIVSCFKSLENQSLNQKEFKVYIALNGSDKSYEDFLKNTLESFSFERELFFLEQPGVSNARNFLIENSVEDYVVFVDDDDVLSESYLEDLLRVSSENTMGIANVYNFSESVNNLTENYIGKSFQKLEVSTASKFKSRKYFSSPWAKMLHRAIIADVRFDTKLAIGEDSLFMAKLSHRVKVVRKTRDAACYYVYEREGSATRKKIDKCREVKRIFYLLKEYVVMFISFRYASFFVLSRIAATLMHGRNLLK